MANFETIHRGVLNFPEGGIRSDGDLPLISISPILEMILVGNALLEMQVPSRIYLALLLAVVDWFIHYFFHRIVPRTRSYQALAIPSIDAN